MAEPVQNPGKIRPDDVFGDKNRPKREKEAKSYHSLSDLFRKPTAPPNARDIPDKF